MYMDKLDGRVTRAFFDRNAALCAPKRMRYSVRSGQPVGRASPD
jgi:hypothetical protein